MEIAFGVLILIGIGLTWWLWPLINPKATNDMGQDLLRRNEESLEKHPKPKGK